MLSFLGAEVVNGCAGCATPSGWRSVSATVGVHQPADRPGGYPYGGPNRLSHLPCVQQSIWMD